jgi:hypothetical protein
MSLDTFFGDAQRVRVRRQLAALARPIFRSGVRAFRRLHILWRVALVLAVPILALNLSVAYFGRTWVFPFSPLYLGPKLHALRQYGLHRPKCLLFGHPAPVPLIQAAEREHHLPVGLLEALMTVESELEPHRISPTGAMGMGQLIPSTARRLGVDDPFDTTVAVEASARYLAEQLAHFHSISLAVAAYNAGPGAVGNRVPNIPETQAYVARVLQGYAKLKATRRPHGPPAH